MKGLVLAGGEGKRLRPFTHSGTKQLVPVANRPVLFHAIDRLAKASVRDVTIVVAPATAGEVGRALGDGSALGIRTTYVVQDAPRGLAHAVATASAHLGESPFAMILGDNVIGADLAPFIARFTASRAAAALWLAEVDDPRSFGVAVVGDGGRVLRLVEKPKEPPSRLALVGVYLLRPVIHAAIDRIFPSERGELEITDAINVLIDAGDEVIFERLQGFWLDTGNKDDLLRANQVVLDAWLEPEVLGDVDDATTFDGPVRVEAGARVVRSSLRGPSIIGAGAVVVDSVVGPHVALGERACVERSTIERSILFEDAAVRDAGLVRDAVIGRRAVVRRGVAPALALSIGDDGVVEIPGPAAENGKF